MEKDPIRQIKSHVFYGREYKFIYANPADVLANSELEEIKKTFNFEEGEEVVGLTDDNRARYKKMIVSDQLEKDDPKELLRVLIDESMHALDSTIDNDVVDEKARDLAEFLWLCGYRRVRRAKPKTKKKKT